MHGQGNQAITAGRFSATRVLRKSNCESPTLWEASFALRITHARFVVAPELNRTLRDPSPDARALRWSPTAQRRRRKMPPCLHVSAWMRGVFPGDLNSRLRLTGPIRIHPPYAADS